MSLLLFWKETAAQAAVQLADASASATGSVAVHASLAVTLEDISPVAIGTVTDAPRSVYFVSSGAPVRRGKKKKKKKKPPQILAAAAITLDAMQMQATATVTGESRRQKAIRLSNNFWLEAA